jgi:hypothetical protein
MHYCDTCVLDWRTPTADISAALIRDDEAALAVLHDSLPPTALHPL